MIKTISILLLIVFLRLETTAQNNDGVWLIGYRYGFGQPVPALDFFYGSPDTTGIFAPFDFFATNASICDDAGNLKFYTNGVYVANNFNQLMIGSSNFNLTGGFLTQHSYDYSPFNQGTLIVPIPGYLNQYAIFHVEGESLNNGSVIQPTSLRYSTVDMNLNNGLGQMTQVNQIALSDTLLYSTMQAVKHANGRDWWIVSHKYNSNAFGIVLLSPMGVSQFPLQHVGPKLKSGLNGQSVFSPDGSKYAVSVYDSNIVIVYDFDRCAGLFSFREKIYVSDSSQGKRAIGCVFSPNSQYLYVTNYFDLFQFNTDTIDIKSSEKLIAINDGFTDPFLNYFYHMQLGPDGKIYINTGNGSQHLHVINNPDLPDTNCNFIQHQLKIINYQSSLPLFPNYRLGALQGSPCDTLTALNSLTNQLNIFEIYPNPNSGKFRINFNFQIDSNFDLKIISVEGKIVFEKQDCMKEESLEVDVQSLTSGVYNCELISKNNLICRKIIILN